jgi:hypothetical protein
MRLYVEGHSIRRGWAISRCWSAEEIRVLPFPRDEELKPVKFIENREKAFCIVERWNRRFGKESLCVQQEGSRIISKGKSLLPNA